jgi:WD40 repeat protein
VADGRPGRSRYSDRRQCLWTFHGHLDGVLCLATAVVGGGDGEGGGRLLFSGGYDGAVKVWDAQVEFDRRLTGV